MASRKHGLPQVAPGNLKELLRLLERGAVVDFSIPALRKEGITQAKHVHALLRALGFLDNRSQLAADLHACRKNPPALAARLRDGIVERCAAYAPQFGDFSFVFDRPEDEAVRMQLKNCLAGEPSINQVVCSLMALRAEVRDRLGLSGRVTSNEIASQEVASYQAAAAAGPQSQEGAAASEPARSNDAAYAGSRPPAAPPPATFPPSANGWRVDEVRDAQGILQTLKLQIRTPAGHVTVSARLEQGDLGGVEVARGR